MKLAGRSKGSNGRGQLACLAVRVQQKQTVMHWQPHKSRPFLQIVLASPNLVTAARGAGLDPLYLSDAGSGSRSSWLGLEAPGQ